MLRNPRLASLAWHQASVWLLRVGQVSWPQVCQVCSGSRMRLAEFQASSRRRPEECQEAASPLASWKLVGRQSLASMAVYQSFFLRQLVWLVSQIWNLQVSQALYAWQVSEA